MVNPGGFTRDSLPLTWMKGRTGKRGKSERSRNAEADAMDAMDALDSTGPFDTRAGYGFTISQH